MLNKYADLTPEQEQIVSAVWRLRITSVAGLWPAPDRLPWTRVTVLISSSFLRFFASST